MSRLIPRGAVVAGLGKRLLAFVIDALPIALIYAALFAVTTLTKSPAVSLVAVVGAGVLMAGYGLYQWWAYATRGAGIGARLAGVRLVSMKDGEPIGWWRVFLRQVVFSALLGTLVGGVALLIFLVIHERRQGWHDMVGGAVVVEPKQAETKSGAPARKVTATSTVGLPPHLASSFSPQVGSGGWAPEPGPVQEAGRAPEAMAAPEWLPGVQAEPVNQPPGGWGQGPAPQWLPQAAPAQPPQPSPQQPPAQQAQWGQPAAPQQQPWGGQPPRQQAPQPAQQQWPSEPALPASPQRPQQNWIPIPSASSVIEPSRKVRVRERDFGEVDDDEGTRIASLPTNTDGRRGGDEGWYLRLDDGREVELSVTVLLGRNPQKAADDPAEVHLVPASGDGRMISRTHVLIGTDPRGVFVVDRASTNGTAVVASGGDLEPCPPGTQVRVREGQQVSYGNRWFTVLRRPVL